MISGSIGLANHPTKPKPQIAATILVSKGVTTPARLDIYSTSERTSAAVVTAKMLSISTWWLYTQPVRIG